MSSQLSLTVIFAHPDDESFIAGGTLARYNAEGVALSVICATRGEAGSTGDPRVCRQEELGRVREAELRCACRVLGVEHLRFLDYTDGEMATYDPEEVEAKAVAALRALRPQVIISFGPDGFSGHPDHMTMGVIAERAYYSAADPARFTEQLASGLQPQACLKLYQIVFPKSIVEALGRTDRPGFPDEAITTTLDISDFWDTKAGAIACHRSQLSSSRMSAEERRKYFCKEYFRLAAHRLPQVENPEHGLFAEMR